MKFKRNSPHGAVLEAKYFPMFKGVERYKTGTFAFTNRFSLLIPPLSAIDE